MHRRWPHQRFLPTPSSLPGGHSWTGTPWASPQEPEEPTLAGPGHKSCHSTNAHQRPFPSDQEKEGQQSLRSSISEARPTPTTGPPQACSLRPTSCISWRPSTPVWTHIPGVDVHVHKQPHHVLFPRGMPPPPPPSLATAWTSHILGRKEAASLSYLPPGGPDTGLRGCWALGSR